MSEGKLDKKTRSAMSSHGLTGETSGLSSSPRRRNSMRDRKEQVKEKKKKKKKEVELDKIEGVRRITLSELSQKIVNCVVGDHVTSEKPWTWVKKELIEDNLELHEESSEFLPIKSEITSYPGKEILIGFNSEDAGDLDVFFICVTEAATEAVQTLIKEQQAKQEARLQNSINKVIKSWMSLGSENEINEGIPRKNRALLEVEIESKYPILPFKIQFRLRTVEQARDGYMELITKDETLSHIFRKRIDNETQVTPEYRESEAQTTCTYPSNASTQYEYYIDIDKNVWMSFGGKILSYLNKNLDYLLTSLCVNRNINLYLDDYQALAMDTMSRKPYLYPEAVEYMSFNDVTLCKGKMISCAKWHPMITGLVAISYADYSMNIFLTKPSTIDEVTQACTGQNPVLIWSVVDPLNPKLILETHREITCISVCPFNENLVVGGAVNGQIVLWDIKNRLQKVEEQEILTNAQIKYRNYMRSLMTWMKNIHDVKVVRATAVSDLRHSHTGAIVRIQWISPYEEVGKKGKAHQFFEDSDERSLQFMTAGEDGSVLIWDLLKKPTIVAGGFRERRLKRLKKKPAGLTSEVSPFRVLHLNLKPIYKVNLVDPKEPRPILLSTLQYKSAEISYEKYEPTTSPSLQSISVRQSYRSHPVFPKRPFVSNFLIGSMDGAYGDVKWEGRDFDLGAIVNSEDCLHTQYCKFHDGPIFTVATHESGKLKLTTGGKMFAIWSDDFRDQPIFWRTSKIYYTHGNWFNAFPNRFRVLRSDGSVESWAITNYSKGPNFVKSISSGQLLSMNFHHRPLKRNCVGVSDTLANFRIIHMKKQNSKNVQNSISEESIVDFLDRAVARKKQFLKWQKEWNEKYAKEHEVSIDIRPKTSEELLKEALDQADKDGESKKVDKKEKSKVELDSEEKKDKPAPGRYLEWVKEKELAKEQERIRKMILKKKNLDTDILERERGPLLKIEQENEIRRKKQKARIKGSETIYRENVAMHFPAIVKEKSPPPPDPYAGGDPMEEKRKCYAYYSEVVEQARRYMNNKKIDLDFDWKSILREGRGRRKYLDNTFVTVTHPLRYERYKESRQNVKTKNPVSDSVYTRTDSFEDNADDR